MVKQGSTICIAILMTSLILVSCTGIEVSTKKGGSQTSWQSSTPEWKYLFQPLGIADVRWDSDPEGISIGSATIYLTPRDMAKLGYLYSNDGVWNGQQVVPADWVQASLQSHTSIQISEGNACYGYFWWIYPERGLYEAWGGAGQRIGVFRDLHIVVVMTSNLPDDENVNNTKRDSQKMAAQESGTYDPFVRGRFPVGVRTIQGLDTDRGRLFPCEIWYPAGAQYAGQDMPPETQDIFTIPSGDIQRRQMAVRNATAQSGTYPLIIFSHSSGGNRRQSTFLCTHLSSHGYLVAALDHSELVAAELSRKDGETDEQRTARAGAWVANRVPDIRFLLDHLLNGTAWDSEAKPDPTRIGIVGHSFGGWTALAATEVERRICAVVALAPGGSSQPKPGILPGKLTFSWDHNVTTMYLVAENDTMTPLAGMYELLNRTPATKQMVILRRADHLHFMDNVEEMHETVRNIPWTGELAWIPKEMRPIAEHCSGAQAHLFVRGLTLCHLDATLMKHEEAQRLLAGDINTELAERAVGVIEHQP